MKINISDEILIEIGKITVVFGYIENSLAYMIGKIVTIGGKRPEIGTIITAELSFRQLISTLSSLLLLAFGEKNKYVEEFKSIKPLIFNAEQERNIVVHSVWAVNSASSEKQDIVRIKATAKHKKGLREDYVTMGLDDICKISELIGEAWKDLSLFELNFHEDEKNK